LDSVSFYETFANGFERGKIRARQINNEDLIGCALSFGLDITDAGGEALYAHAQALRPAAIALHRRLRQVPLVPCLCMQRQRDDRVAVSVQRGLGVVLRTALLSVNRSGTFQLSA
jgi:hypothetical protein